MSVDLVNASHFDVNDASQGFSVWTEKMPGLADNWYFVMPNLHELSVDGKAFEGVAIKLCHSMAISWDGRIIWHCTSLSRPDGVGTHVVGSGKGMVNHLNGTFIIRTVATHVVDCVHINESALNIWIVKIVKETFA
jgi:hypothetical protein